MTPFKGSRSDIYAWNDAVQVWLSATGARLFGGLISIICHYIRQLHV